MSAPPVKRQVYWIGDVPKRCEISDRAIADQFVDGKVPGQRYWAFMHPCFFHAHGGRLGTGHGQLYARQPDGRWLKIEG